VVAATTGAVVRHVDEKFGSMVVPTGVRKVSDTADPTVNDKLRRGLLIVLAVLMVNAGIFLLTAGLIALYQRFLHPAPMGNGAMQPPLVVQCVEFCMIFLIAPSAMTSAYSHTHNWLTGKKSVDLET
jgi:hypothetical protein